MKSFRSFLTEAKKLSKSEQDLLNKFTSADEVIDVMQYFGTGRIRGGGSPSGARQMKAAKSLIDKGILVNVAAPAGKPKGRTSTNMHIYVKYPGWKPRELTDLEIRVYNRIKDFEEKGHYKDRRSGYFRMMKKPERDAHDMLYKLGYVTNDSLRPSVLKPLPK